MIHVVNLYKEPCTLYIGRAWRGYPASKWANPFPAAVYGRFRSLNRYESHARATLWNDLHELDDQTLGCWCKPKFCHGDVLKKLREEQLNALRGATVSV